MKKIKEIDFWVSVGLIILFTILYLATTDAAYALAGYFVIGSWQVISMIVHAWNHWFTTGTRLYYHWTVFISLAGFPLTCVVLLFIAPLMAVFYATICYREVYIKMKRPLALLK